MSGTASERARAVVSNLPGWGTINGQPKAGKQKAVIPVKSENARTDDTHFREAVEMVKGAIGAMLTRERWTPHGDICACIAATTEATPEWLAEVVNAALREGRAAQAWESRKTETSEAGVRGRSEWKLL